MLRMARFLAAEKHPVYRNEAARVREEALGVLEAVVQHPKVSRPSVAALHDTLAGQLAAWPNDADVWIGDRAVGLHAYEMVRYGHLLSLIPEEIEQYQEEGVLEARVEAILGSLDEDELFYLESMRAIINACEKPYFERAETFARIRAEQSERSTTAQFPTFAANILLPPVEEHHAVEARDRALCEAWTLALAAALDRPAPGFKVNPLTGKPYAMNVEERRVVVWGADFPSADTRIIVPRLLAPPSNGHSAVVPQVSG